MVKDKKDLSNFAYPGRNLGVIEEYMPGPGTYIEERGYIRSLVAGQIQKGRDRIVRVEPEKKPQYPSIDDEVMGVVVGLAGIFGILRIEMINNKIFRNALTGILYPTGRFLRNERQFMLGDIVYARVESIRNRTIHLDISDGKFGVIKAWCNRCGGVLVRDPNRRAVLICRACRGEERRKISNDYGRLV
jgi:exosome complex component CSL4